MLDGGDITTNVYADTGTSFAAPTVAGIAALIAAGDTVTYGMPDGDALKTEILASHTSGDISGIPIVTMTNLP